MQRRTFRIRKLYGYICIFRTQLREQVLIVLVYFVDYSMSAFERDFFNRFAHFAVAYQCNAHKNKIM